MKRALELLRESEYLKSCQGDSIVTYAKFLKNGRIFKEELCNSWKLLGSCSKLELENITIPVEGNCLSFLQYQNFAKYFHKEFKSNISQPIVFQRINLDPKRKQDSLLQIKSSNTVSLVRDYFIHSSRARDTYYNIQRERKIWWMRYSADPSRYVVGTLDPSKYIEGCLENYCQAVTIKSLFSDDAIIMETIVWAELNPTRNVNNISNIGVSVVRSVVDLNLATIGLLLDSAAHGLERNVLKVNQKLAPYQCLLVPYEDDDAIIELCSHLQHVLQRSGLRVYNLEISTAKNITSILSKADLLGIPFTIIVKKVALKTGLLRLRNRDTTLSETVHISDLSPYINSIFKE
ncbi:DNA polymerase subunit gamma-2, mitochondrial-like isoform X1 [Musca domestica]|uniref:DNA polymerase subunit gamma-2, mitochondrial-like isoform X1 n=1 Tax=Musca domestica TaxID=7370 RepID=A0A1I8MW72_MUSDO|nr:DNA polymerase subunit gamma-2, mitochondrial-like isoform X1 [Musca domestica]